MNPQRIRSISALLLVLASLTGCGKELTAGGRQQVEFVATDREPASQRAPTRSVAPSAFDSTSQLAPQILPATLSGTVRFQLSASLRHETGDVVPITPAVRSGSLRIAENELESLARATVRAGRYTHLILDFNAVSAEVEAGAGTLEVVVGIGTQPLRVERSIDLQIDDSVVLAIVEFDLRTSLWAPLAVGGIVPAQVFSSAVSATVR